MNISVDPHGAFRAEVQSLCDRGWQVVRLRPGTKMAFEKDWPTLKREAHDFQPGDNVGVRFGPQSGGLVDVDLDYPTARKLVGSPVFGLDHLVEFGRNSLPARQRGHRLAIVPDGPGQSRVFGIRSKGPAALLKARGLGLTVVEIRGSHGSQTAVPPSVIRAEGKKPDRLVWTNPLSELPEMSWAELNRRVGLLAFAALAAAIYPTDPGDRDGFCAALYGALLEAGATFADAQHMVDEVARVDGDASSRDLAFEHDGEGLTEFLAIAELGSLDRVVRRWLGLSPAEHDSVLEGDAADGDHAPSDSSTGKIDAGTLKQILDRLDPCDFGDYDSHREMLHAAHHATGGDKAARKVFIDWCGRNPDFGPGERDEHGKPWSEVVGAMWDRARIDRGDGTPMNTLGTLLHHLKEADQRGLAAEIARKVEAMDDFADPPPDLTDLSDDAPPRQQIDSDFADAGQTDWTAWYAENWVAIGHRELNTIPPTPWLTEGLLLYNDVTTIGGRGGSGKSLLGWQIVASVATGRALAWWPAPERARKVLVISGEDDVNEIERRVSAACQAMGIKRSDLGDNFMVWSKRNIRLAMKDTKTGAVSRTKLWQGIRWAVENLDVGLIVMDPLVKVSSGFDESSNDDMDRVYGIIRDLTVGYQCAALTIDHFAKGGTGGDQASIRGASAKVDAARVAATLTAMTEKEFNDLKPPRPREAYVLYVDPKQNYARKTGGHWLELVEFEVGNGEVRPSLIWRDLSRMEGFVDPQRWQHRTAFLQLVDNGRDDDGHERQPWSVSTKGKRDARLDVAVSQRFRMTETQALQWIQAFAQEGSIIMVERVGKNRTTSNVWAVNRDYQSEEDTETEAIRL